MTSSNALRRAVKGALLLGAASSTALSTQAVAQAADSSGETLESVIVTGSRIRRVDQETASPVLTVTSQQIKDSGVATLGDFLQQIPTVAGAATNPSVNNGGGDGASNVELRGLGAERTLLLLNGRRIGVLGQTTNAVDVNMIPLNMIERVEVLKEGAGAVYGSDAIAGVVNVITHQQLDGADISVDYGATSKSDGKHHSVSLSWGAGDADKNILIGLNYNKQREVSSGTRDFSKNALYLYSKDPVYGVFVGGSSRTPAGHIDFPASDLDGNGDPIPGTLTDQYGCPTVTRIDGTSGASMADYRCYVGADSYNYQPLNLVLTPQERGSLFVLGNYDINDHATVYAEVLYNRTHSGYKIAPLPFDSRSDDIVIPTNNYYNPFGIAFGGITAVNPNAKWRLEALGQRRDDVVTASIDAHTGVKGRILDTSWTWDVTLGYGRMDQDYHYYGYLYQPGLQAAFGPSFLGTDGNVYCGTSTTGDPADGIRGCTPVNIFNLTAAGQAAALRSIAAPYTQNYTYRSQEATVAITGELFKLPAGAVQGAFGFEYHDQENLFSTDYLTESIAPLYLTCLLASETCTASSTGQYDVKEYYGEIFLPLLADMPGAKALNVTIGARYSDYSTFGNTTNSALKLEYRPISDLLVRASYTEVFRAPTLYNLSHGPIHDAPTFQDPCNNLTAADLTNNPALANVCVGVPTNGSYSQAQGQVDGLKLSTPTLKPEEGHVFTWGLVYEPSWLQDLSLSIDFWDYKIDNLITELDPNYTADQCMATGSSTFCGLIYRNSDGSVLEIQEPVVNLGLLKTRGVDLGVKYALRDTPIGAFRFTLDTTRIQSYENTPAPGQPAVEIAGTFDKQFGNYARWRGTLTAGWALEGFDALVVARYIDSLVIKDAYVNITADLDIPSVTYFDASVGYSFPTNTKIRVGMDNMFDKQPPLFYQNNVLNSNTDVSTYDVLGRRWYLSLSQKF